MTGCGWGSRGYDSAHFTDGRPDFRGVDYTYYDQPHLHFMVFGRRYGKKRSPKFFWDPFGAYTDDSRQYPLSIARWANLPETLWL